MQEGHGADDQKIRPASVDVGAGDCENPAVLGVERQKQETDEDRQRGKPGPKPFDPAVDHAETV